MNSKAENYLLNPPVGSKAAEAVAYGIDLTLVVENLRLTPAERIKRLQTELSGIDEIKGELTKAGKGTATSDLSKLLVSLLERNVSFVLVGDVAMTVWGFFPRRLLLEVVFDQDHANIELLDASILQFNLRIRGSANSYFEPSSKFKKKGEKRQKLISDLGPIDLLTEIDGVGKFSEVVNASVSVELFGYPVWILTPEGQIENLTARSLESDQDSLRFLEILVESRSN